MMRSPLPSIPCRNPCRIPFPSHGRWHASEPSRGAARHTAGAEGVMVPHGDLRPSQLRQQKTASCHGAAPTTDRRPFRRPQARAAEGSAPCGSADGHTGMLELTMGRAEWAVCTVLTDLSLPVCVKMM